jgi:CheY-like chemotaxis protein
LNDQPAVLDILVVDDDADVIRQLKELLPDSIGQHAVTWDYCGDFDEALKLLQRRRFDLLVSDIYRDRDKPNKNVSQGDVKARELVDEIRARRFCPVVLFTDGQVPAELVERPFVWSTDKAATNFQALLTEQIAAAIDTGLPHIARRIHDELDRYAGSYVWQFLAPHWEEMKASHNLDAANLERIIKRRAAVQFTHFEETADGAAERATSDPADFYLYPPISGTVRLGQIIRRKATKEFRVVLTPRCFLVKQPGQAAPRASHVLTALTIPAGELLKDAAWNAKEVDNDLRRRTAFPASKVAPPEGRYCFLPAFLEIPDLYCDLMQLESFGYQAIIEDFDHIAVLDSPYAEALQACLARLMGAVGLPELDPKRVAHLAVQKAG